MHSLGRKNVDGNDNSVVHMWNHGDPYDEDEDYEDRAVAREEQDYNKKPRAIAEDDGKKKKSKEVRKKPKQDP